MQDTNSTFVHIRATEDILHFRRGFCTLVLFMYVIGLQFAGSPWYKRTLWFQGQLHYNPVFSSLHHFSLSISLSNRSHLRHHQSALSGNVCFNTLMLSMSIYIHLHRCIHSAYLYQKGRRERRAA